MPAPELHDALLLLIDRCGEAVTEDPRLLEAGLLDIYKGGRRRDIKLLCDAVRIQVPRSLKNSTDWKRRSSQLVERLVRDCALDESAATAAVAAWSTALMHRGPSPLTSVPEHGPSPLVAEPRKNERKPTVELRDAQEFPDDAMAAFLEKPKSRGPAASAEAQADPVEMPESRITSPPPREGDSEADAASSQSVLPLSRGGHRAVAAPGAGRQGLGSSVPLPLAVVAGMAGIAVVGYLATRTAGPAQGHVPTAPAPSAAREVVVTVVAGDRTGLACASDEVVVDRMCGFTAQATQRYLTADRLLQPFTTVDGMTILAAGLWAQLGTRELGDVRTEVRCQFAVEGSMHAPMLRWNVAQAWQTDSHVPRDVSVGLLKNCLFSLPPVRASNVAPIGSAKFSAGPARVVDLEERFEQGRLTLFDDVITDGNTSLAWQHQVNDKLLSASDAGTYCSKLDLSGRRWRVPNAKELLTLVRVVRPPTLPHDAFPGTPGTDFWSEDGRTGGCPRVVSFAVGTAKYRCEEGLRLHVRCVSGDSLPAEAPTETTTATEDQPAVPAEESPTPSTPEPPGVTPPPKPSARPLPTIDPNDDAPM